MLEMLNMKVMCWVSALMPTLPPSCVFHCVAISSKSIGERPSWIPGPQEILLKGWGDPKRGISTPGSTEHFQVDFCLDWD